MMMPYVFQYHFLKIGEKGIIKNLIKILNFKSTNFINEFKYYFENLGVNVNFLDNDINLKENIDELILNVNVERLKNNPVKININKMFNYE